MSELNMNPYLAKMSPRPAEGEFVIEDNKVIQPACEEENMPMVYETLPLAMAYVPIQKWGQLYEPEVGMSRGTIFAHLDLPFLGMEAVPRD